MRLNNMRVNPVGAQSQKTEKKQKACSHQSIWISSSKDLDYGIVLIFFSCNTKTNWRTKNSECNLMEKQKTIFVCIIFIELNSSLTHIPHYSVNTYMEWCLTLIKKGKYL